MNEEFNNPFSLTKLKAYLFDLISKETTKQQTLKENISKEQDTDKRRNMEIAFNEKSLILNNIINKANELTLEIEKLTKDNSITKELTHNDKSSNNLKKEAKANDEEVFKETNLDNTTPNDKTDYPEVILSKETNDPAKAIIVNIKQFKKLQASKITQQELVLKNKTREEKINTASDEVEEESKEKEDISNEEKEKTKESEKDAKAIDDKEENIEELLNKANALYKEGNLQESEALYEKISTINKQKQNKTHVKVA